MSLTSYEGLVTQGQIRLKGNYPTPKSTPASMPLAENAVPTALIDTNVLLAAYSLDVPGRV